MAGHTTRWKRAQEGARVLAEGAAKASAIAKVTLARIYDSVGLLPRA